MNGKLYHEDIRLSKKCKLLYKKYLKLLNIYGENEDGIYNFFDILNENLQFCEKFSISEDTLRNVCDFIYMINTLPSYKYIYKYLHNYNFIFPNNYEYSLFNGCIDLLDFDLTKEDIFLFNFLVELYKKTLYEIIFYKRKYLYKNLPIDALMVAKGNLFDFNRDDIILQEIMNSSYARINNILLSDLIVLSQEDLLKIHKLCFDYAKKSIANNIANISGKYGDVFYGGDNSFLIRRLDLYDKINDMVIIPNDRYAVNCSVINSKSPNVYPFMFSYAIFGYSNIEYDQIFYINAFDSYTASLTENMNYRQLTGSSNVFYDFNDLNERTFLNNSYNELVIKNNKFKEEQLTPSYLLARNHVDYETEYYSKNLNLPIVILNTKNKMMDRDILYSFLKK